MHLIDTNVSHDTGEVWKVEFFGDEGEMISVRLNEKDAMSECEAVRRAKAMMVDLTAFGTRGGGHSVNDYDTLSNGNFDNAGRCVIGQNWRP